MVGRERTGSEQETKAWEECDDDIGATSPHVVCRSCDCTVIFAGLDYGREVIASYNTRISE